MSEISSIILDYSRLPDIAVIAKVVAFFMNNSGKVTEG